MQATTYLPLRHDRVRVFHGEQCIGGGFDVSSRRRQCLDAHTPVEPELGEAGHGGICLSSPRLYKANQKNVVQ